MDGNHNKEEKQEMQKKKNAASSVAPFFPTSSKLITGFFGIYDFIEILLFAESMRDFWCSWKEWMQAHRKDKSTSSRTSVVVFNELLPQPPYRNEWRISFPTGSAGTESGVWSSAINFHHGFPHLKRAVLPKVVYPPEQGQRGMPPMRDKYRDIKIWSPYSNSPHNSEG